jgi:hypothetical protein
VEHDHLEAPVVVVVVVVVVVGVVGNISVGD